jgi:NADP-dependent 3-hydroxy acid dehydrogenase YdfG
MEDTHPATLVTGASGGIGAATALMLLARGHRVAATGRDAARLASLADQTDAADRLLTIAAQPDDDADITKAVASVIEHFGRLDHVVANAGFSTHDTIADGDPEAWRKMLLTNVLGPAVLIKAALPELRRTSGRIVLVGSVAGEKYLPGNFYGVTKWAVKALAENTRMLVAGDGVGVSLIAPGKVETPFWDNRSGGMPPGPVLHADAIAESIAWVLGQPAGTDVNTVVIRPTGQPI